MPRLDRATRDVGAASAVVFAAFLDPDSLAAWLPPAGMTGELRDADLRQGGGFTMELTYDEPSGRGKTTPDSDLTQVEITEVVPDQRVVWRVAFESDDPEYAGRMTMTWTFTEVESDDGPFTRVAIDCTDVPPGIDPDGHQAGLDASLANLARFVEP